MQAVRMIAVTVRATDGSGKSSAVIIPIAAISARPTNGWRGTLSNFIYRAFRLSGLYKASRKRHGNTQYTTDRPNVPSFRAKSRNPVALPEGNTPGSFDFASLRSG